MVARRAARRVRENKFSLRFISVANPRVGNISAVSYLPASFLSLFDGGDLKIAESVCVSPLEMKSHGVARKNNASSRELDSGDHSNELVSWNTTTIVIR